MMVKVLPPLKPEIPLPLPGSAISVAPSPHTLFLDDYEYYDQLGRDPLQLHQVWSITDATKRVEKLKEVLKDYPKQVHRRKILFKAAGRGDEHIVRFLVETGMKIHPDVPQQQTEEDQVEYQESIPDEDDPSKPPVHMAASSGRLGCLKIFIEEGHVEVDLRDDIGRTLLLAAAISKDIETIKYLLAKGADPTARPGADNELARKHLGIYAGADALELAAGKGHAEAVKLLLDHPVFGSAGKNKEPSILVTPLSIKAAARQGFETLSLLLERGAYPMVDRDGKTKAELLDERQKQAIIDATPAVIEDGDWESLKLLLSYQYPTDKDDKILPFEVPDALHKPFTYGAYEAMLNNKTEKFEFLYSFGLKEHDSMSLDKLPEGQTLNIQHLLENAVIGGSIDCLKLMVEKCGANPNVHRMPGALQPLWIAASRNKPDMVRCLLEEYKADLHLGSGRFAAGPTALWVAITLKSLDCVAVLLQHGGPVNHVDEDILNISKPLTAVLIARFKEGGSVRFETEDNAKAYIENMQADWQNFNPGYVRVQLVPDDRIWIRNIQLRRPDEELREEGENARELNEKEAVKNDGSDDADPRQEMVVFPTVRERREELEESEDFMPLFKPAFVPSY